MIFQTKFLSLTIVSVAVVTFGLFVLPKTTEALGFLFHRDDPLEVSSYRLSRLNENDYASALQTALERGDFSLARQLIELADSYEVSISDKHRADANPGLGRQLNQAISDSAAGALTGDFDTTASLAGAIASDLTGIGDVRDVVLEGRAAIQGHEYDALVLGLASAGLLLSGGALLSAGAASPADTGVSVIKNAYKTGQISQPLLKHIRRSTDGLVDVSLLRKQFSEIESLRPYKAKAIIESSIDFGKLSTLTDMSKNVGRVSSNADISTAVQALRYAENGEDLARATKLSSQFGKQSRAVFSLLGRGALVATGLFLSVSAWILTGVLWLLATAWITYRLFRIFLAPLRRRS